MSNVDKQTNKTDVQAKENVGHLSEEIYKMIMELTPICTMDIIFFSPDKTQTLVGKRNNEPYKGIFYTFGGRLWKNETFEEAALRVARKETGIVLEKSQVIFGGVKNEINNNSLFKGVNYHSVALYSGCIIPTDTKVRLDKQTSEYKWIDINDPDIHPNVQIRITETLKAMRV